MDSNKFNIVLMFVEFFLLSVAGGKTIETEAFRSRNKREPGLLELFSEINQKLTAFENTLKNLENKQNSAEERLQALEKKLSDYEAKHQESEKPQTDDDRDRDLKEELTLLKKGFTEEKQVAKKKLKKLNTTIHELEHKIFRDSNEKQIQMVNIQNRIADIDKNVNENGHSIRDILEEQNTEKTMTRGINSKLDKLNDKALLMESTHNGLQVKLEKLNEESQLMNSSHNYLLANILEEQSTEKTMTRGINSKLDKLNDKTTLIESTYNELQAKLEKLNEVNQLMNSSHNYLLAKLERQKVAFSARLSKTTPELSVGSTIVFDGVAYQTGGGYNPQDGVFTCPESGVYLFSVVLLLYNPSTEQPKKVTANMAVNDKGKLVVISESRHQHHADQGSNMVVLSLNKGDRVWVRTHNYDAVRIYYNYSTFSGALLYN